MEIRIGNRKLRLVQGDITRQATDAIVNAANSSLMGGGGVDGAIHQAGGPRILEECLKILAAQGRLPAGKAVITSGGKLPAKYVIHTVGPFYDDGQHDEARTLASAYLESLRLAEDHGLQSLAFPSISTGSFSYPLDEAAGITVNTIALFLQNEAVSVQEVVMVLFDRFTLAAFEKALQAYLDSRPAAPR
jgi:O-acetyl-ADP-ribose deacetylase